MILERCRSHEVNSRPMAWEVVSVGTPAMLYTIHQERHRSGSGDVYRFKDGETIMNFEEFCLTHIYNPKTA